MAPLFRHLDPDPSLLVVHCHNLNYPRHHFIKKQDRSGPVFCSNFANLILFIKTAVVEFVQKINKVEKDNQTEVI